MECPVKSDQDSARQRPPPAPSLQAHLEASVRVAADAIIGTDRQGVVIAWNPAAERLFGLSAEEAIGQLLITLIAPQMPDVAKPMVHALSGQTVQNERIRHVGSMGAATYQTLTVIPSHNALGTIDTLSVIVSAMAQHYPEPSSSPSFQAVVERLPVAMFLIAPDASQTRLYVSPAVTAITGYSPEEFADQSRQPGWHWTESVHPQDRARVAAEDAHSMAAGESFQMEYRFIRKDGSVGWVRDLCIPMRDGNGAIANWLGVLVDITDEVEAVQTQAHLAAIVEAAADGILSVGLDGTISSWNQGAERIYGYSAEEAIGQPVTMLRPPELTSQVHSEIASVWEGAALTHYETERLTRDGRRIPVSLSVFPIRDADGEIVATSSITHDLSPLRQAEAAERLRNKALDVAQSGMVITDPTLPDHPIVDVNPAFTTITGYTREEVIGRNCRFLQGPDTDPEAIRRLGDAIAQGRDTIETLLNYRRDGTPFWNTLSLAPVRNSSGALTHFVGVLTDVTDRVQLEQELRAALAAAEAGNDSKRLFLAMMSHELRTPLQSILGYADFLQEPRSDPLTQQQREDVLAISEGAQRMSALIKQILEFSRIDHGPLGVHHEQVELKPIIDVVLRELTPQIAAKGLQVSCELPAPPPQVLGDAGGIYQVLSCLAGNAVKFTPEGDITIAIQRHDDEVEIQVTDTGVGIAEHQLPGVFEPFRQAHDGLIRPYEGAGLGLTIAQRLVQQMHGRIAVESELGAGSTFTVWLPIAES